MDGIPNPGLIEGAIARPYMGYYRSMERKAAALVESMARNHGFADGNKRTTLILMHTLLIRSGYVLRSINKVNRNDAAEAMVLAVVKNEMSFDDLVAWFKARLVRLGTGGHQRRHWKIKKGKFVAPD
jgi:death on curing protein